MKHIGTLSALLLLLIVSPGFASEAVTPPLEIADAATIAVDWSHGAVQSVILGGNRTITFANGQKGGRYTLIITQDATGSRLVTWPSSARWLGGAPQTVTTLAHKTDYFNFFFNGVSYDALGATQNL